MPSRVPSKCSQAGFGCALKIWCSQECSHSALKLDLGVPSGIGALRVFSKCSQKLESVLSKCSQAIECSQDMESVLSKCPQTVPSRIGALKSIVQSFSAAEASWTVLDCAHFLGKYTRALHYQAINNENPPVREIPDQTFQEY